MSPAREIEPLAPGLFIWQNYDPAIKADLFSTGIRTSSGWLLIDPIPLEADAWAHLGTTPVAGIAATNLNHCRAVQDFAARFAAPVFAHSSIGDTAEFAGATALSHGERICGEVTVVEIEGAAPGEIALHSGAGGGAFILGDALINFGPHGFDFLPAKYCSDPRQMRRSLQKLLGYHFERMLFAHGAPIMSGARARLEALSLR